MKNKRFFMVLLLSLTMIVSMFPATGFAYVEQTGTKDKPFLIEYSRNGNYYGNSYDCSSKEIWFKFTPITDSSIWFEVSFKKDKFDVNKITFLDDNNEISFNNYEEDGWVYYETEAMPLKEGNDYFIKVELNKATKKSDNINVYAYDNDYDYESKGDGTEEDPYDFSYDSHARIEYAAYRCLDAGTKTFWCVLDACDSDAYKFYFYFRDGAKKSKIQILDESKENVIATVSKYDSEDKAYYINSLNLEKGKKYFIKTDLSECKDDSSFDFLVQRVLENGTAEKPYIMENSTNNGVDCYCDETWQNQEKVSEMWFKADILSPGKITAEVRAYNRSTDKDSTKKVISSAKLYINSQNTDPVNVKYDTGYEMYKSDYVQVKAGDVVYIKVALTSNFTAKDVVMSNLFMFGLKDVSAEMNTWEYVWDGKAKKPKVLGLYDGDKKLVAGKDYDPNFTYNNNIDIGTGEVIINGKGDYPGYMILAFDIKPIGTKLSSVATSKKAITVKWDAQKTPMSKKYITGYQVQYSTSSKFTNAKTTTIKGYKNTSKKISKLNSGKKYYVRVRTYYNADGWNLYSKWSTSKSVKVK